MVYQLIATDVAWDKKDKLFRLSNYLEKTINPDDTETLNSGNEKTQSFGLSPEELFPNDLEAENKNTPDLIKFIEREKIKGNSNLNTYLNELHQRTSMPVSIFILSILALSLSSQKRRGGIGQNLAIGISLAFTFIFSFEVLKVLSSNQSLPPLLAMWIPNIIFGAVAIHLYRKRANE